MDFRPPKKFPSLKELGLDAVRIPLGFKVMIVLLPFALFGSYFLLFALGLWPLSLFALVMLSFFTYGSISHDYVHRSLGLPRRLNDLMLVVTELLMLRSGTAYKNCHLKHHAIYPHPDDVEGAMSSKPLWRALLEGPLYVPRLWLRAWKEKPTLRLKLAFEALVIAATYAAAIHFVEVAPQLCAYVVLISLGSWFIPIVTAYFPHTPHGDHELLQTTLFRGSFYRIFFLDHLYHLEHHLYPSIPHVFHPRLARTLDPYFDKWGVPVKHRDLL